MTQPELDRAVALVTGEDLPAIRRRGFSLADPAEVDYDPEPLDRPPQVMDWDAIGLRRNTPLFPFRTIGRAAAAAGGAWQGCERNAFRERQVRKTGANEGSIASARARPKAIQSQQRKGTIMPVKLSVGLSKKVGEVNYGSRGASVSVEVELDFRAVEQPDRLRSCIRKLCELARTSLDEELHGRAERREGANGAAGTRSPNGENGECGDCGESRAYGENGENGDNRDGGPLVRPATEGQIRAISGIARRRKIDLPALLCERFRVERPENLSLPAASSLIDELRHNNGK